MAESGESVTTVRHTAISSLTGVDTDPQALVALSTQRREKEVKNTNGLTLSFSKHAREQMEAKGFVENELRDGFTKVTEKNISPNRKFEGQFRVVVGNVCLVGKPMGREFKVFTMYEDGVMTPPRKDQLDTPEGRAYAKLYEQAKRKAKGGQVRRSNEYWPRVHERRSDAGHTLIK